MSRAMDDQGSAPIAGGAAARWTRVIAHADMDAFYASVEELDRPELRGKPIIVGGSSARGVVTSASYAARKFGVHSAMPSAQARQLCPDAIFVRGRMERYEEVSRAVRGVFDSFSPMVEPLSLDEAFLDLTGSERLLGDPIEVARALKRRVLEVTGLIVSVGVAPTKMAAKILSDISKPDGLLWVEEQNLRSCLEPLPVERFSRGCIRRASRRSANSRAGTRPSCGAFLVRSDRICTNWPTAAIRVRWLRIGSANRTAKRTPSNAISHSIHWSSSAC
jgi:hypothetical protein